MSLAQATAFPLAQIQLEDRTGDTCIAQNGLCPEWIVDNFDRYVTPFLEHVYLVVVSVSVGFVIAFGLALIAHRQRWLVTPIGGVTQILYTVPSIAAFFLLQPITGRGALTAIIALVAYTLLIFFRNITTGLQGVSEDAKDAARGMGLTDRQMLWKVELPLAMPEILAGLRIASTTTVGLAALAFFAGGGGLGAQIDADIFFKSNVVVAGGLAVLLAAALDLQILAVQRFALPWRARPTGHVMLELAFLDTFGDAIDFIFNQSESVSGGVQIGGLGEFGRLTITHLAVSLAGLAVAIATALPLGLYLGHTGRGEFVAIAGRTWAARCPRSPCWPSSSPTSASASSTSPSC